MPGRSTLRVGTAAVVLAISGLVLVSSEQVHPVEPVFAYHTKTELIVRRGDTVIAREAATPHLSVHGPTWTLDGRYLAWLEGLEDGAENGPTLVAIDSSNGQIRRQPCPGCTSVAPIGDSRVLVSQANPMLSDDISHVTRFDLSKDSPPTQFTITPNELHQHAFLYGGAPGFVLAQGASRDGTELYQLLGPDGSAVGLKSPRSLGPVLMGKGVVSGISATAGVRSPDGTITFAIAKSYKQAEEECETVPQVFLSTSYEEIEDIDLPPLAPPGQTLDAGLATVVADMWWTPDGKLHAVFVTKRCVGSDESSHESVWVLANKQWTQEASDFRVLLADSSHLVLDSQGLWRESPRGRVSVDRAALAVIVPHPPVMTPRPAVGPVPVEVPPFTTAMPSPAEVTQAADDLANRCLSDGGTSLGDRSGDIDGDGTDDLATLIRCDANQHLAVQVRFGNGKQVAQSVSEEHDQYVGNWLGISDINGDGRDDLVFVYTGGAHLLGVKLVEYRDGRFTAIRGDDLTGGLTVDGSIISNSGFTCNSHNGAARLVLAGVALKDSSRTIYEGEESILEADKFGVFHKVSSRQLSYPAIIDSAGNPEPPQAVADLAGAHCDGLNVVPS